MTAGSLKIGSRAGIVILIGCAAYMIVHPLASAWEWVAHFALYYALTLSSFLSFPTTRRNDVSLALMVGAVVAQGTAKVLGVAFAPDAIIADGIGVLLVHVPSHIEALRKCMRDDPWLPAFTPQRLDRRRSTPVLNLVASQRRAWSRNAR